MTNQVEQIQGDLFASDAQVIVCPVNIVGAMGKGLAAEFARRFPGLLEVYRLDCKGRLAIGRPTLYKRFSPWVLCFPTKKHYKDPSRLEWIEEGLAYFVANYQRVGICSVAWPRLGCGEGRLSWEQVEPIMVRHLSEIAGRCQIVVYHQEPPPLIVFNLALGGETPEGQQEKHKEETMYAGSYPPPNRDCLVCGRRMWVWTGESYKCESGDQAHEERERDMREHPERYYE